MISYGKTPYVEWPAIFVDKKLAAWVCWNGNPMRFEVWDETAPLPDWTETFETLAGADKRLWEIARREQAKVDNAKLIENERRARAH